METFHIIIKGRVQGVGFRAKIERCAKSLGAFGTVKNLPNGTVELYLQMKETDLSTMLGSIKEGRGLAKIEHISTEKVELHKHFEDFKIIF